MEKSKPGNRNALVHGIYTKDFLLPWDSRDDFEKLHADLRAEFMPVGRAEEETVFDLAQIYWQKHTVWRMRQAAVLKDPFVQDISNTERKSWSGIRKDLRAEAMSERTFLGAAEAELANMFSQSKQLRRDMKAASDQEEVKLVQEKINAVMDTITKHAVPFVESLRKMPNAEQSFDAAYLLESLEQLVRLEAALDVRVAKALARLVGLKEFKRTPAAGNNFQLPGG